MSSITCTRRIQFCAGHRVKGHENKCAHMHGHNYVVLLEARCSSVETQVITRDTKEGKAAGSELDTVGRVIDFSVLKDKIGGWIERNWDHGWILHEDDHRIAETIRFFNTTENEGDNSVRFQKCFALPFNPTAENLADYLLNIVGPLQLNGLGVELCKVTVWETENCFAVASLKDHL